MIYHIKYIKCFKADKAFGMFLRLKGLKNKLKADERN
jgi:hypothetical protein